MTTHPAASTPGALQGILQRRRFSQNMMAVLLLAPAVIVLGVILFYPIGYAIYASFFHIDILNLHSPTYIGLQNYQRMIQDPDFWNSLRVTVVYTLGTVLGTYSVGLLTALLLKRRFPGLVVARTLIIMPWAVPQVVAVLVWSWIFNTDYGVANYLLQVFHLTNHKLAWLQEPNSALVSVFFVTIWTLYPVATVMLLAGLHTIPEELYEAAAVDGAAAVSKFRHITWPGLAPVNIVLILLLSLLAFTRVVTIIYVMTGGGPSGATDTLPIETYLQAFKYFNLGYASTVGTIVLAIAFVFTIIYFGLISRLDLETT